MNRDTYSNSQFGSATIEYVVLTGAIVIALFLPIPLLGVSALEWVFESLRAFQAHSLYVLSIP